MDSVTTFDGVNIIALAYREKSDNGKKKRAKEPIFLRYFLATDCFITLPGIPVEKKQHYPYVTRAP